MTPPTNFTFRKEDISLNWSSCEKPEELLIARLKFLQNKDANAGGIKTVNYYLRALDCVVVKEGDSFYYRKNSSCEKSSELPLDEFLFRFLVSCFIVNLEIVILAVANSLSRFNSIFNSDADDFAVRV